MTIHELSPLMTDKTACPHCRRRRWITVTVERSARHYECATCGKKWTVKK